MRAAGSAPAARWIAAGVIVLSTLICLSSPYNVDYETTLLPWLMSKGWVMYRDIIEQHPPLLPALLSVTTGGNTGSALQVAIALQHFIVLWLCYLLASRLAGPYGGLCAVLLAELWTVPFDSNRLWYDSSLAPLYLLLLLLLARRPTELPGKGGFIIPLAIGTLMGASLLMKQQALVAVPFVLIALLLSRTSAWKMAALWFVAGLVFPLVIASVVLASQGALAAAWHWVVLYSITSDYSTAAALSPGGDEIRRLAVLYIPLLAWLVAQAPSWLRPSAGGRDLAAWRLPLGFLGLAIASTLSVWPRYAGFHLQAAIPLLAVIGAITLVYSLKALRARHSFSRVASSTALVLLAICATGGAAEWVRATTITMQMGPFTSQAPYAATLPPLRKWVDAHASGFPLFIYGLDPLLYPELGHVPTRPYAPQLSWILSAIGTEASLWSGFERANPPVVLVAASAWDESPGAGPSYGVPRLRLRYQEAARFTVRAYSLSPPVEVVGLTRVGAAGP